MKERHFQAYRAFHEQGFIPIFVHDHFDSKVLIEASVAAGCKGIEYTLRRSDAREMIPWIRKNYPDLFLLVGSTLDNEKIVTKMRKKSPQLMTIEEVAQFGVDGFVSMLGWTTKSIQKYSPDHIVVPMAMTVNEALAQAAAGAHLIKILGDIELVTKLRWPAAFGYCPIMVTGGMTPDRIPQAVAAGAIMTGSGFDLICKDQPADIKVPQVTRLLTGYLDAMRQARAKHHPELTAAMGGDSKTWLDALPHYHPF